MNSKYYLLLVSLILPNFIQANTLDTFNNQVLIAIDEKNDQDAQDVLIQNEKTLVDAFYAFDDIFTTVKNSEENLTGNVLTNDSGSSSNTAILIGSPISKLGYGSIQFSSDGSFTYIIDNTATDIKALSGGESLTDSFSYQISTVNPYAINYNSILTRTANLTINIIGQSGISSTSAIYAMDDEISILKGTVSEGGNVTANDKGYLTDTAELTSAAASSFGSLQFKSSGEYLYTPFATSTSIINLGAGQVKEETFTYQITGLNNLTASATLTVRILGGESKEEYYAFDDQVTINYTQLLPVTGNVNANDNGYIAYSLISSPLGNYGTLIFQPDGSYSYQLDTKNQALFGLTLGTQSSLTDTFSYQMTAKSASGDFQTVTAQLIITIIGDNDTSPVNIEVENNDRSTLATTLNPGQSIKGHLHTGGDVDWYSLKSLTTTGEIIHIELCPTGTSCYEDPAKQGWIMYIFDAAKLKALNAKTGTTGELQTYPLSLRRDDTLEILNTFNSNHMYLNYIAGGAFTTSDPNTDALIGIVDPCFDTSNTVDIGVPAFTAADTTLGYKEYLIAISSSLEGSPGGVCGAVTVVLEEPGPSFEDVDIPEVPAIPPDPAVPGDTGTPAVPAVMKTITTTEEYISIFPRTDDQYTISVSSTTLNPLASSNILSASYVMADNRKRSDAVAQIIIPEIRILDDLFKVVLNQTGTVNGKLQFALASSTLLSSEPSAQVAQSSYNLATDRVRIPKLTVEATGLSYSVELEYFPAKNGNDAYLELIGIIAIN